MKTKNCNGTMASMKPNPTSVHCHPRMLFNRSKHSVMMTGPEKRIPINNSSLCTENASTLNNVTIFPVSYSARAVGDNLSAFSYNAKLTAEYICDPKWTMHVSYLDRHKEPMVGARYNNATMVHWALCDKLPRPSKCFTSMFRQTAGTNCSTPSTK